MKPLAAYIVDVVCVCGEYKISACMYAYGRSTNLENDDVAILPPQLASLAPRPSETLVYNLQVHVRCLGDSSCDPRPF